MNSVRHHEAMRMKIAIALGIVYVVWGSTYLAIAVADRTLPPLLMLAVRFGLAGGLLYVWSLWRGDVASARLGRREWTAAAVVGGLLLFVDTGGVAWAEQRVASGLTALLVATVPLFSALLDRKFFGVRLSLGALAGIATGLLGVALLVGPSAHVDPVGAAVILVAAFAWAAGSRVSSRSSSPKATANCSSRRPGSHRRGMRGQRPRRSNATTKPRRSRTPGPLSSLSERNPTRRLTPS